MDTWELDRSKDSPYSEPVSLSLQKHARRWVCLSVPNRRGHPHVESRFPRLLLGSGSQAPVGNRGNYDASQLGAEGQGSRSGVYPLGESGEEWTRMARRWPAQAGGAAGGHGRGHTRSGVPWGLSAQALNPSSGGEKPETSARQRRAPREDDLRQCGLEGCLLLGAHLFTAVTSFDTK